MSDDLEQSVSGGRMGRPTLCTPEVIERYCKAVRLHLPQHLCAAYAGVSADTVQAWAKRGAAGEEPFATFVEGVSLAKAETLAKLTKRIERAGRDPKEWRATLALVKMHSATPLAELSSGTATQPHIIDASEVGGPIDPLDPERLALARIKRLEGALTQAQAAGSHVASMQLSRDLDKAIDALATARRAKQVSPADQDEETFLQLLTGSAEAMPEAHLRVFVDVYCARHRAALTRDPRWKRDENGEWYLEEDAS